jgi:PHD/YefM family antitoxin component YafN of YafNO toxin-antitoxin module
MNTITIAEIKRGGMAALDMALHRGTATIMKRNRPAAIVLTPAAYEVLLAKATNDAPSSTALDWLLNASNAPNVTVPSPSGLDGPAMAQRLSELKTDWLER